MEEISAWRQLLGKLTNDTQERQRIARALDVNPVTLVRWSTGKSSPRLEKLRLLLDVMPQYTSQFIELIPLEIPDFQALVPKNVLEPQDIPSGFYTRVLKTLVLSLPISRTSSIFRLISQQILAHLDPKNLGMLVLIAQCSAPRAGQKVRSMRLVYGRGTSPWHTHQVQNTHFFGAESLIGRATLAGHFMTMEGSDDLPALATPGNWTQSMAACPIVLSDSIPACIFLASTRPNLFTPEYQSVIECYADLLVVAFPPDDLYPISDLAFGVFPPPRIQQLALAQFRERVNQRLIQASQNNPPLTRPFAELQIWQELEEELLNVPWDPL